MKKHLLFYLLSFIMVAVQAQGPGCPNINAGPDQVLPCNTNCTTLNATLFQTGATNTYTVSAIGYAPPAPSTGWTSAFVNTDDIWSGIINLPFNFCYYGAVYNRLVVGANGVISFNTGYANQFCPWSFTAAVPSPTLPLNAIFGAYHDIDPAVCGQIRYAISGTYPCRTFMFDFDQVCHYNCNGTRTTQRIVLYETSNVIEIYLGAKPVCAGWNGGRAVVGIQNSGGDQGLVAPGRQTGAWNAGNEGWRFTPSGTPNYQVNWYSSGVPGLIGTGTSINVCPTNTFTTYSAILTYTNCDNSTVTVSDFVNVTLTGQPQPTIFNNSPCPGQTLTLNTNAVAGATYVWAGPGGWTATGQAPTRPNATAAMSGTYTLYIVVAGCTSSVGSKNIAIIGAGTTPTFTVNTPICAGTTLLFNANTYPGATYVWSGPGGWNPGNVEDPTRAGTTAAMSGVYSLYIVSGGCTSATATRNVVINAAPTTPIISSNTPICTQSSINLFGPTIAGATYVWSGPGGWSSNLEDPTRPNANAAMTGTYSLYVVVAGCTSATANTTVTVNGPPIPTIDIPQRVCPGSNVPLVTGTYAGVGYHWSGPNGFTSTSATPSITGITAAGTGTYSLYLTLAGCTSITVSSYMEVISVSTPTPSSNTPVCVGGTLNLTSNTIAGATYFWTGPNGFSSGLEDPSIISATTAATGTYNLYVVTDGCTSATATTAVTVNPIPTVAAIGSQTVCSGAATTAVPFVGTVGATTFNWTNSNPAIGLAASGTGDIPSFTTTNPTTANISGTITVTPTANGCPGPTQSFTITVRPTPTVNSISNISICNTATNPQITVGGPVPGSTFAWTNNNTANGIPVSGNGNIPSYTATNTGTTPITTAITITPTANGCTGPVSTFNIIIYPTPTIGPITNQTYCNGASSILTTPTGNVTGTTFNWTNDNTNIGLGANGNGNIPIFMATNTGNTTITGTISVTPSANACVGNALNYNVDVYPTPSVNAIINQTICQGNSSTLVTPVSNVTGATFTWTNSNPVIGLPASGNGDIPSFTGLNNGTAPITSTITVTPTANGCAGTPTTFTITVNPTATFANIPTQTYCPGATTTTITPNPTVTGTTYTWTSSNPAIGLSTSGVGDIPSFTATNPSSATINSTVVFIPTANNCVGTPLSFLIEVSPTPNVSAITNQTVCNGQITNSVSPSGNIGTSTYTWTNSNPAIGLAATGNGDIPVFTAVNTGTTPVVATITVTPTANGCVGTPNSFTITVNPAPNVNNIANQDWCNGTATALTPITGNIINTTYSWNNDNPAIGLPASGNGDIPSFTATNPANAPITANITVTPSANGCLGIPFNFTITVNPTPTVNPTTPQTLCNGASTNTITFVGNVTGTSFDWTNNTTSIGLTATGNGNIAPFTAINTGTAPVTATLIVTPSANNCTGAAETSTITVNPTPALNPVPPQILCNGASTTAINFVETVVGTSFGWTNSTPSIGLAASGNGNINSFTATNTGTTPVTATITVTPSANACTGTPETFTITVNPTPTVNDISPQTLCHGASTTAITFVETVAGTSFGWTNSTPSIGLAASGNGNINSFTATNTGTTPVMATITVTPSANGCAGTPDTFTITVNPIPTVNDITPQTLCNGSSTTAITFVETVTGTSFGWTNDTPSIGLVTSGNGNIASFAATNTGNTPVTATITVTPSANACTGTPETFTITVNPTPTVNDISPQTLCNGASTTAITFVETVTGTSFDWTNSNPSIGLAANGNGNIASFAATNTGTTPVTATITVTPSVNGCTGTQETFTITVNPTPTVNNIAPQILCNGASSTAITFLETVAGTSFDWTNSNPSIGLAATGNGNIASFAATNTGNTPVTATITVTPSANVCTGTSETFTITVNPTPTVNDISPQTLCNGASTTAITFVETVAGTSFDWTNSTPSIGLAANGNGNINSFTATNTGTTPVMATITVTPSANGCTGTPDTFTITVNPIPTVNTITPQTLCNGSSTTAITFVETVTGTSFDWTNSAPSIGLTANGNGGIPIFTATNTGDTTVTATITVMPSVNGCNGTAQTFTITVKPTPTVDPITPQTLCNGAPTTAINFVETVAGTSFDWTNNTSSIGLAATGNGNIASFTATNTGITAVSATITVTPSANNCTGAPETFTIIVNPTPNVATVNPQTLCNGELTSSVGFAGTVNATSFDWTNSSPSIGLAATGNGDIAQFTAVNNGPAAVTASITVTPSVNGCSGTPQTFTITVNRTYIGVPVLHTMCNGGTYNFGGQNYTATGNYPIVFQAANGCDSTVTLVLTVNPTYNRNWPQTICTGASVSFGGNTYNATGNYPITFQTINGCDSLVTLQLTVTPNPAVVINPQVDQCFNGHDFDFSLAQTFAPGSTIDWTFAGANTPNASGSAPQDITYPTAGQYTVVVDVTENSCQSQGTLTINVLDQPEALFNASPPIGCVPMKVGFTNLTTGGGNLLWNFTGGTPATSTTSPVDVVYNTAGQYSVSLTVTYANGCSDTETATNLINAQAVPTAGFSIEPEQINMGNPTATFINNSTGGTNIYYYVGDQGGISGPTGSYTFAEQGTYDVMQIVTSLGGCSDTAFGQLVVIGHTEVFIPNAFTPDFDNINTNFKVAGYGFSEFHMMIFNRWGELLFESHNQDQGWDGTSRGKDCKTDVYVYKIELRDHKNSLQSYIGSVTLVK